jgi:hypothetical protein
MSKTLKARDTRTGEVVDVLVDDDFALESSDDRLMFGKQGVYIYHPNHRQRETGKHDNQRFATAIIPVKKGSWVSHLNGDKLDNRRANLGYRMPSEVMKKHYNSDAGLRTRRQIAAIEGRSIGMYGRGVNKVGEGSYVARHGQRYLGTFSTPEAAGRAWDRVVLKKYGEDARKILNFPQGKE